MPAASAPRRIAGTDSGTCTQEPWNPDEGSGEDDEDPDEETVEHVDDLPEELHEMEDKAHAVFQKATQRVVELRKARGYYRRSATAPGGGESGGESSDGRKQRIHKLMQTAPCRKCGKLGHWARERPRKDHVVGLTWWVGLTWLEFIAGRRQSFVGGRRARRNFGQRIDGQGRCE